MDSDEEIEKFHQNKLSLDQPDSDENSESEFANDLTHQDIQKYLDNANNDSDDSDQNDADEISNEPVISGSLASKNKRDIYGADRDLRKLSRADREIAENAILDEVLKKKRAIENLMDQDELDPELVESEGGENEDGDEENRSSDNEEPDENAQTSNLPSSIQSEANKYQKIYEKISNTLLPKIEQNLSTKSSILSELLLEFLTVKRKFLLDFLMTIAFYLSIINNEFAETSGEDYKVLKGHPCIARLKKYEKMLENYEDGEGNYFMIDDLIETQIEMGEEMVVEEPVEAKNIEIEEPEPEKIESTDQMTHLLSKIEEKLTKKSKTKAQKLGKSMILAAAAADDDGREDADKREITREMAKNKGTVLSKKKKIDRNPRVKFRQKFKKAKVRQKGQIKPMRDQSHRYEGERGIRMGVTTSRKF